MWNEWKAAARFLQRPPSLRRIVFYAEGARDLPFYEGLLEALLQGSDLSVAYLTSDPKDPLLAHPPQRLHPFYFKHLLPWVFLTLEAKALVMTVPDLHRYHLRRSTVRGVHHVYLFHALCSTHMIYRFGAFDHYDAILCAGPHQVQELKKTESLYRLAPKRLVEVGYPRLDRLIRNHRPDQETKTVLIAPSWGRSNLLESCPEGWIRAFRQAGFRVVVRPHPETLKRHPQKVAQLARALRGMEAVELELNPLAERSFHEAAVLVTDWSGIALEYAFATERPVLFIETPPKINNPRYGELNLPPLEVRLRSVIGKGIPLQAAETAPQEALALLRDRPRYREKILSARKEFTFHLGDSAQVAARFLLDLAGPL